MRLQHHVEECISSVLTLSSVPVSQQCEATSCSAVLSLNTYLPEVPRTSQCLPSSVSYCAHEQTGKQVQFGAGRTATEVHADGQHGEASDGGRGGR